TTGPDGNLWFTETSPNKIGRITPAGVITEFQNPNSDSAPIGIVSGPGGKLWFAANGNDALYSITTSGMFEPHALSHSGPWAITVGPDGNLWFTSSQYSAIGKFSPTSVPCSSSSSSSSSSTSSSSSDISSSVGFCGPVCGDSIVMVPEECDKGSNNS